MGRAVDESKAEALCDFFSSMFNKEKELYSNYLENKNCIHASECPVFEIDYIKSRLQELNVTKSSGPDGIQPRILYETANQIAYPLQLMFQSSFNNKQLPID